MKEKSENTKQQSLINELIFNAFLDETRFKTQIYFYITFHFEYLEKMLSL